MSAKEVTALASVRKKLAPISGAVKHRAICIDGAELKEVLDKGGAYNRVTRRSQIQVFDGISPNLLAQHLGLVEASTHKTHEYNHVIAYRHVGYAAEIIVFRILEEYRKEGKVSDATIAKAVDDHFIFVSDEQEERQTLIN